MFGYLDYLHVAYTDTFVRDFLNVIRHGSIIFALPYKVSCNPITVGYVDKKPLSLPECFPNTNLYRHMYNTGCSQQRKAIRKFRSWRV